MKYRTIVADPPWEYPEGFITRSRTPGKWQGPERRYYLGFPSMGVPEIAALPVPEWADTDCRLFLWTTNRYLPDAFGVLEAWGFRYRQTIVWHKTDAFTPGSVAGNSAEFLLAAVQGKPTTRQRMRSSVVSVAQTKQHSRKPECFLDYIEQVSPAPYLELFARRNRLGWDTWGNEALEHVVMAP
jgi:N6-adenosine-specific RNA methylase IME4